MSALLCHTGGVAPDCSLIFDEMGNDLPSLSGMACGLVRVGSRGLGISLLGVSEFVIFENNLPKRQSVLHGYQPINVPSLSRLASSSSKSSFCLSS